MPSGVAGRHMRDFGRQPLSANHGCLASGRGKRSFPGRTLFLSASMLLHPFGAFPLEPLWFADIGHRNDELAGSSQVLCIHKTGCVRR